MINKIKKKLMTIEEQIWNSAARKQSPRRHILNQVNEEQSKILFLTVSQEKLRWADLTLFREDFPEAVELCYENLREQQALAMVLEIKGIETSQQQI